MSKFQNFDHYLASISAICYRFLNLQLFKTFSTVGAFTIL